jgi:signal transduction histidine kinase
MQLSGSHEKQVAVRTRGTDKGEIRIDISDTGPGMDEDTLARAFESFFTTKGDAGMGMGLSISRSIIEAHGGQVWATSTPGQGATFSFTLPGA